MFYNKDLIQKAGITKLPTTFDELLEALKTGGLPCTRDELAQRFTHYLDQQMRGHAAVSTRLSLG